MMRQRRNITKSPQSKTPGQGPDLNLTGTNQQEE